MSAPESIRARTACPCGATLSIVLPATFTATARLMLEQFHDAHGRHGDQREDES